MYIHCIKRSLKLSHWHFLPVPFSQTMVGWVAFKVSLHFMLRFKPLKCDGQCLFLHYSVLTLSVTSHSLRERNVAGNKLTVIDH